MIITIAAVDLKNGIGKNGGIPWKIPGDLKFFKDMSCADYKQSFTEPNIIIMGRKTWQSTNYYSFPARYVLIISESQQFEKPLPSGFMSVSSFEEAEELINKWKSYRNIIIAGGEFIYKHFIFMSDIIFLTTVFKNFECDRFFPEFPKGKENPFILTQKNEIMEYEGLKYQFKQYNKIDKIINYSISNENLNEKQYLNLLQKVIENGNWRKTRNDETLSYFGTQMDFDISHSFPLLTTKRVYWKGVLEELLWFIKGDTNNKNLKERGVHIWDGNSTTDFMEKYGHSYNEDICGPIYGWQWRHFNKKYDYIDRNTGERKQTQGEENGYDQLAEVIRLISEEPHSRRIFMSGWNPNQLDKMVLPPCHVSYQFYVNEDKLSCHMYQRSGDLFLGVPFNIASTAALVYLLAKMTDKKPDRVIISIGDAHIYKGHLDAVYTQMSRMPFPFPKLNIKEKRQNIEDYTPDDFEIIGYDCHPTIKAEMVA